MMIDVKVKTLDNQTHSFTVKDDLTILAFKSQISDTVNIPADVQRLIYCGRVLQDAETLTENDLNGKVIHLVERPPPGVGSNTANIDSPRQQQRQHRPLDGQAAVFLGSLQLPGHTINGPNYMPSPPPPPPIHSLVDSRLNLTRRMLRTIESILRNLENPSTTIVENANAENGSNADNGNTEESTVEVHVESTPIIQARVIVPQELNAGIGDESMILDAVRNSINSINQMNGFGDTSASTSAAGGSMSMSGENMDDENVVSDSPAAEMAETAATSGAAAEGSAQPTDAPTARNGRTSRRLALSVLLSTLTRLQERFQPFLDTYRRFIVDDPVVAAEERQSMNRTLAQVSEVMHLMSHVYHAISDLFMRAQSTPPRALLCYPVMAHQSPFHATFPIHVAADVHVENGATMPPASTTAAAATSAESTDSAATAAAAAAAATTTATSDVGGARPSMTEMPIDILEDYVMAPNAIHFHNVQVQRNDAPQTQQSNNESVPPPSTGTTGAQGSAGAAAAAATSGTAASASPNTSSRPTAATDDNLQTTMFLPNNTRVEFIMEMSPDGPSGNVNQPPPEFWQSIAQMAGQIINSVTPPTDHPSYATTQANANYQQRDATVIIRTPPAANQAAAAAAAAVTTSGVTGTPTSSTTTGGSNAAQTTITCGGGGATGSCANGSAAGQNSQARGNTQTNPTTATHTRSTPRPHVHLTQQAIARGFDPFLPCHSHHVYRRRIQHRNLVQATVRSNSQWVPPAAGATNSTATATSSTTTTTTTTNTGPPPGNPQIHSIVNGILNSIRTSLTQRYYQPEGGADGGSARTQPRTAGPPRTISGSPGAVRRPSAAPTRSPPPPPSPPPRSNRSSTLLAGDIANNEATALVDVGQMSLNEQSFGGDGDVVQGLMSTLLHNFTFEDILGLQAGSQETVVRFTDDVRQYLTERLLEHSNSLDLLLNDIICEIRPLLQKFNDLHPYIEISQSLEKVLTWYLPEILVIATNLDHGNALTLTGRIKDMIKSLCAIMCHISGNVQHVIDDVFKRLLREVIQNIPECFESWLLGPDNEHLHCLTENLVHSFDDFKHFLVYKPECEVMLDEEMEDADECRTPSTVGEPNMEINLPSGVLLLNNVEGDATVNGTEATIQEAAGSGDNIIEAAEWHSHVPEDWIPIITRDVSKQRRASEQEPLSDAYLAGMPNKRRKLINNSKLQCNVPQAITDGVRQAVSAAGVSSVVPVATVAHDAGNSADVQAAVRNMIRTVAQSRIGNSQEFNPERYPNAAKYLDYKPK